MLPHAPTTLLLYPEWIIWLAVGFAAANLVPALLSLALLAGLSGRRAADLRAALRELEDLRAALADLRARHAERRERLGELMAEHEALRRKYDELWREHQETCDLLGPMLPHAETGADFSPRLP